MKSIIELAKQAGYQHLPTVRLAYSGFDLKRFADLVRAAALEEAAGVCEVRRRHPGAEGADMSDCIINWRFGVRHFQIYRNAPYVTFNVNPYWLENKPSKWFERY